MEVNQCLKSNLSSKLRNIDNQIVINNYTLIRAF